MTKVSDIEISHFMGGPVGDGVLKLCLVPGGSQTRGWTVLPASSLNKAIELAYIRCNKIYDSIEHQGPIRCGQTVRVRGLVQRPDLNGEIGIAIIFNSETKRWDVRLRSGEGKQIKTVNLEGLEGSTGRVHLFWGCAQWTRTQLLGEIAKGNWGLCKANVSDVFGVGVAPKDKRELFDNRLMFAPVSEMTESYLEKGQAIQEMNAAAFQRVMQRLAGRQQVQNEGVVIVGDADDENDSYHGSDHEQQSDDHAEADEEEDVEEEEEDEEDDGCEKADQETDPEMELDQPSQDHHQKQSAAQEVKPISEDKIHNDEDDENERNMKD
jgi:hypothetical protein